MSLRDRCEGVSESNGRKSMRLQSVTYFCLWFPTWLFTICWWVRDEATSCCRFVSFCFGGLEKGVLFAGLWFATNSLGTSRDGFPCFSIFAMCLFSALSALFSCTELGGYLVIRCQLKEGSFQNCLKFLASLPSCQHVRAFL